MARKRPLSAFLGFLAISVLMGVELTRIGLAADPKTQMDKDQGKDKKVPLLFVQTAKGATVQAMARIWASEADLAESSRFSTCSANSSRRSVSNNSWRLPAR